MRLKPGDRLVVTLDGGHTVLLAVRLAVEDELVLVDENGQQRIDVRRLRPLPIRDSVSDS